MTQSHALNCESCQHGQTFGEDGIEAIPFRKCLAHGHKWFDAALERKRGNCGWTAALWESLAVQRETYEFDPSDERTAQAIGRTLVPDAVREAVEGLGEL